MAGKHDSNELSSLLFEKMKEYRLTQEALAKSLLVSRRTVAQLLKGERSLTSNLAIRLAKLWSTTPEFWLNLQAQIDLRRAAKDLDMELRRITPLR